MHLPRYLPRKGTETPLSIVLSCNDHKNLPRYLPRKGTETQSLQIFLLGQNLFATIFTPQGDGNHQVLRHYSNRHLDLPRYLPRKGTETTIFFSTHIAVFKIVRTELNENGHSITMRKPSQKILLGDGIKCISDSLI